LPKSPCLNLNSQIVYPQKSKTYSLQSEKEDACLRDVDQWQDEVSDGTTSTLSTPKTPSIPDTPDTPGTQSTPSSPITPGTPTSSGTPHSLSDFDRPSSSQFSRSTDLNSRLSEVLSGKLSVAHCIKNNDLEEDFNQHNEYQEGCSGSLLDLHFSSAGSSRQDSSQTDALQAPLSRSPTYCKQLTPSTCLPDTPIYTCKTPQSQQTQAGLWSMDEIQHGHQGSSHSVNLESRIQSKKTDSSAAESLSEWSCWPVLPPIMKHEEGLRGHGVMEGSPESPSSRSQSAIFAELDDLAPRSSSCVSLDHPAGSQTDRSSSTTDLSPGLAALTVGCDSGDLGSLSRVQLLLFQRRASESPSSIPSPECSGTLEEYEFEPGLRVWSSGIPQYYQSTAPENRKHLSGRNTNFDSLGTFKNHRTHCGFVGVDQGSTSSSISSASSMVPEKHSPKQEKPSNQKQGCVEPDEDEEPTYLVPRSPGMLQTGSPGSKNIILVPLPPKGSDEEARNMSDRLKERRKRKKQIKKERKNKALQIYSKLQEGKEPTEDQSPCSKFEDFDFLAKYCILNQEKLSVYKRAFEAADSDGDGYLSCLQVLLALKEIIPPELLTEEEEIYILELVDFRVTEGLTDLRLFAVVASLAQKIATLDDFMRSLISKMDFKSLEMKLHKAKKLFLFLLEAQTGGALAPEGCIEAEQLLVELKAGGIRPEHEASVRRELRNLCSLDLLDFLAHLPLFILIHNSVIDNPFDDSSNL
ncbi:hypothetical protein DNTS_026086, partial [Danionella cerebrum]